MRQAPGRSCNSSYVSAEAASEAAGATQLACGAEMGIQGRLVQALGLSPIHTARTVFLRLVQKVEQKDPKGAPASHSHEICSSSAATRREETLNQGVSSAPKLRANL